MSPIQEAQMTTVTDPNVHNIAVRGTFDDCQVFLLLIRVIDYIFDTYGDIRISSKPSSEIKNLTQHITLAL